MNLQHGQYKNITGTGAVTAVGGILLGFYVNSTTGGTLVLKDWTVSAGTTFTGTITPAIGWHFYPAGFGTGLYATIANTLDVTFVYRTA